MVSLKGTVIQTSLQQFWNHYTQAEAKTSKVVRRLAHRAMQSVFPRAQALSGKSQDFGRSTLSYFRSARSKQGEGSGALFGCDIGVSIGISRPYSPYPGHCRRKQPVQIRGTPHRRSRQYARSRLEIRLKALQRAQNRLAQPFEDVVGAIQGKKGIKP
ncbi:MAG: hypothetical protein QNK37_03950 [Acidobacteriota bacterium]|nr:hypothetical protein [Acidobacteriota bacterium]